MVTEVTTAAVRGCPAVRAPLCAGLPTPHTRLTEGLPELQDALPLRETFGRRFRRGQETFAEREVQRHNRAGLTTFVTMNSAWKQSAANRHGA
jgi:hypothetical protein